MLKETPMIRNICIIPGTLPEVIKMSPVVGVWEGSGAEWFMIRTGQDCSCDMGLGVLWGLGLPDARYNLGGRHWGQIGSMDEGSRFKGEINGHKRTH